MPCSIHIEHREKKKIQMDHIKIFTNEQQELNTTHFLKHMQFLHSKFIIALIFI